MADVLTLIPGPLWAALGVVMAALIGGAAALIGNIIGDKRARAAQNDERLSKLVDQLQEEVSRLGRRVESLEHTRDAYRSWSHVLWDHIVDVDTPRLPPPAWPENLSR